MQLHEVLKEYKEKSPPEWRLGQWFVNTYEVLHPWPDLFYARFGYAVEIIDAYLQKYNYELKERQK